MPQQLLGALFGRSANILVSCAIHDAEHAMKRQKKAVLVTLDVKGPFDAVIHGRLLQRMKRMGWPDASIYWIKSFLRGRSTHVRHEDGVTDPIHLECGLPQGSPLFSILFLLYMAEVVGGSSWRFGYADDVATSA